MSERRLRLIGLFLDGRNWVVLHGVLCWTENGVAEITGLSNR